MKRVTIMLIGLLLLGFFTWQNRQPITLRVLFWKFGGIATRNVVFSSMILGAFLGGSVVWIVLCWHLRLSSKTLPCRSGSVRGGTVSQTQK